MAPGEIRAINQWRKDFNRPYTESQVSQLERLSKEIDRLWARHTDDRRAVWRETTDRIALFGQDDTTGDNVTCRSELAREQNGAGLPPREEIRDQGRSYHAGAIYGATDDKDRLLHRTIHSKDVRNSSAYRRLKLVMDYWCALWFWPMEKAELLPTREEYLFELSLILEGNVFESTLREAQQLPLFPDKQPRQLPMNFSTKFGFVDVDRLCREIPRLSLVQELSERYRFLHWELEFADIFADRGGFDLVLGNPPWIKVEWNEGGVMGDAEPLFVLRSYSAPKLAARRFVRKIPWSPRTFEQRLSSLLKMLSIHFSGLTN